MTTALIGGAVVYATPAHADDCATQGCWSTPFSPFGEFDAEPPQTIAQSLEYPAGVSVVMLPDGRLLYWNGLQNLENCNPSAISQFECATNSKSEILDLTSGGAPTFTAVPTNTGNDLFCSTQGLLADGRVVVAGGTHWGREIANPADASNPVLVDLEGSRETHVFGQSQSWTEVGPMAHPRWYPTMLTLSNGNLFVAGGVQRLVTNTSVAPSPDGYPGQRLYPQNIIETETLDPSAGTWSDNGRNADVALPLVPRMHLLPNGEVVYTGAGQMWGSFGESIDQLEWNFTKIYNPATKSWRDSSLPAFTSRSGAFSAMLPLRPDANGDYPQAQFLVGGGVLGATLTTAAATNLSEVITAKPGVDGIWATSTEPTGTMVNARWFGSAVVLPNGQVVAVSGADRDGVLLAGTEQPVRQAELFDPATRTWTPLSSGARDRTYHNSAVLLPDGSVLVGGHAPINLSGNQGQENNPVGANNLKDPSFERFYPAYLSGARPQIQSAQAHATWGQDLIVTLAAGSEAPVKIVLSRLPAVTHTTDADNRTVQLPGLAQSGASVHAQIPANRAVLPPGYYYVFAVSQSGTPSVATIVQIADPSVFDARGSSATPVQLVDMATR